METRDICQVIEIPKKPLDFESGRVWLGMGGGSSLELI